MEKTKRQIAYEIASLFFFRLNRVINDVVLPSNEDLKQITGIEDSHFCDMSAMLGLWNQQIVSVSRETDWKEIQVDDINEMVEKVSNRFADAFSLWWKEGRKETGRERLIAIFFSLFSEIDSERQRVFSIIQEIADTEMQDYEEKYSNLQARFISLSEQTIKDTNLKLSDIQKSFTEMKDERDREKEKKENTRSVIMLLLDGGLIEFSPFTNQEGKKYYYPTSKFTNENIKVCLKIKIENRIPWKTIASFQRIIPRPYGKETDPKPIPMTTRQLSDIAYKKKR